MTLLVALFAWLALAATAPAAGTGWSLVRRASDSSDYYASASLNTTVRNARGLKVVVAASAPARVKGSVTCTRAIDFEFESYDFAFRLERGYRLLRVPLLHARCSVYLTGTLADGGTVTVALYRR